MSPGATIFLAAIAGVICLLTVCLAQAVARAFDEIDTAGDGFDYDEELEQLLNDTKE